MEEKPESGEATELETLASIEEFSTTDEEGGSDVDLIKAESAGTKVRTVLQKFFSKKDDSGDAGEMKKEINLVSGVAYIAGGMIGSGIFITPNGILNLTHSFGLTLIVWFIGGVTSVLYALCYIELALVVKKSGAEYSYIKEAYSFKKKHWSLELLGSLLAYMFAWASSLIIRPSSLAIITLTSARYLVRPFFIDCDELPEKAIVLVAIVLLSILAFVNCVGLKSAAWLMSYLTFSKIITVILIVILGLVSIIRRYDDLPSSFLNPFENLNGVPPTVFSVALSLYSVQFSYDGWYNLSSAVEETKNVKRTLPLSVYIGVAIVTVSYLMVNISYFAVLSSQEIIFAIAVALPFSKAVIGTAGLVIFPILVAKSAFGAANGTLLYGSRILFVSAREGLAPKFLSGLHASAKTPVLAILSTITVAMIMAVVGSIEILIQGVEFIVNFFVGLSIIGLFILRVTHRDEPRIYSAWFIIPIASCATIFIVFILIIPLIHSPIPSLVTLGITLVAIPVYFIFIMEKPYKIRPKFVERFSDFLSRYVSLVFNTWPTSKTEKMPSAKYTSH